ncbi:MAG: hypothetical protein U0575_15350, partial [Phycisphaerales bacterium]
MNELNDYDLRRGKVKCQHEPVKRCGMSAALDAAARTQWSKEMADSNDALARDRRSAHAARPALGVASPREFGPSRRW